MRRASLINVERGRFFNLDERDDDQKPFRECMLDATREKVCFYFYQLLRLCTYNAAIGEKWGASCIILTFLLFGVIFSLFSLSIYFCNSVSISIRIDDVGIGYIHGLCL